MCDSVCMHISTGFLCTVGTWSEEHSSKVQYSPSSSILSFDLSRKSTSNTAHDFVILICLVSDMMFQYLFHRSGEPANPPYIQPLMLNPMCTWSRIFKEIQTTQVNSTSSMRYVAHM